MLSRWYQRKFLKKLDKNIKWSNHLKHRSKFLSAVLSVEIIPLKIRVKIGSSSHVSWITYKYMRLTKKLITKAGSASDDYLHYTSLNNSIAGKFLNAIKNESESEAKDHE